MLLNGPGRADPGDRVGRSAWSSPKGGSGPGQGSKERGSSSPDPRREMGKAADSQNNKRKDAQAPRLQCTVCTANAMSGMKSWLFTLWSGRPVRD